ncbi:oxygen-dependent coproporphyrinogen oxidase [Pelagibacteraceae bacterium]|jgi:coproporphyrinogen III oxidase|nr:oxygen-dependent coproporphyrinogen oxidase [Pelagibacteraceae bacterium]
MIKEIYLKKKLTSSWFSTLQQTICYEFKKIEEDFGKKTKQKPGSFKKKSWKKSKIKNQGGGNYFIMKNGLVFDSVGINFSKVSGKFKKKFRSQILGAKKNPNYWATGISVVAHMKNPKIPALHFNTRFITTSVNWFGGGMDATPCIKDHKEEKDFHNKIMLACNKHNNKYYPKYKKWCDNYFYLPHRNEKRGIGGIFFDYKKDNWKKDFDFVKEVGLCFLDCAKAIIRKKMYTQWNKMQKEKQFIKRGRYVEFNLLYDRGTKFGLDTGGNVEAILMSLPPEAKWK